MKKQIGVRVLLIMLIGTVFSVSATSWKVFLYADSSDNLSDMIIKNITQIMQGKPNDTVDFVIQLHAYYATAVRYRATKNGLEVIEEIALSNNNKQDFIDAAQWAFAHNNADHTMLILSDHGWGILDPQWNEKTKEWQASGEGLSEMCSLKNVRMLDGEERAEIHRGFLFTVNPRAYLSNQALVEGLAHITTHVLGNKKLDIIAFDTCMGDMFEIGYIVAPYAHYLVGNQSCSLTDGFAYQGIVEALNKQLAPAAVATAMVQSFDEYYTKNDQSGVYTHGALDLSHIYTVSKALDCVVAQIMRMPEITPALLKACDEVPRFCLWPMYTDLVAWAKKVEDQITQFPQTDAIMSLKAKFNDLYQSIKPLVVARCGGRSTYGKAHGFAIYLPDQSIDRSYYNTNFVRESQWGTLLEYVRDARAKASVK